MGLIGVMVLAHGCDHGIDTTRQAPRKATLGDDIYALMCDRIGASSFAEDLVGASYHSICHFDSQGQYGDTVDLSVLPPVNGAAATTARQLSVAKMEGLAQRRAPLIRALNAGLPDIDIPDPTTTENVTDTVRLHDALLTFSQDITELYEHNPFEPKRPGVMPMVTDAFGRLFGAIEGHQGAREALMRVAGRQGYRPFNVGMGAIRTLLAYPEMRPFITAQLDVLATNGTAIDELQQLLTVVKRELLTSTCELCLEQPLVVSATDEINRARSTVEVIGALMLDQNPAYAPLGGDVPRYLTKRDSRGFAIPVFSTPGVPGSINGPFVDVNNDGFADVDTLGRFVDAAGIPLLIDTPFKIPGKAFGPEAQDGSGRPAQQLYEYIDTSQTLVGALARDLVPLLDPNKYPGPDAQPWLKDHETVMYALAGIHVLAGPREQAQFDHSSDTIVTGGQPCPISNEPNPITGQVLECTSYQRFVGEQSPIPDLVHAMGQVLADPDSDVILQALMILIEDHEQVVARLLGAGLRVKEIADEHDADAAMGKEPKAELAYEVPIWDEMAQIVSDMADHPGLFRRLLEALANPVMVSPHSQDPQITGAPAKHFGETLSAIMINRDQYNYNLQNINGPAINVTDGYPSLANPHNLVDRSKPLNGANRSMFERSAQLIYDGNGVKACNKDGAVMHTTIVDWPLIGSYKECELFVFSDVGAIYLDTNLPSNHPKRAELKVVASDLNALLNFVKIFTSADAMVEQSSGLDGLTLHPTPQSLNRLLFYGANSDQYGKMPDYDTVNAGSDTDKFISQSIEPVAGVVCPQKASGVHKCADNKMEDVMRMRVANVIFGWERLGFYQYLAPQLQAFAETGCNAAVTSCNKEDFTGETFFLDLVSTLWRHWPDSDHGSYCDHNAPKDHPRYCSAAGANHYEPILGDAFLTDIMPALHEFAKVAKSVSITIKRGPKKGTVVKGTDIVEWLVKILFSQKYAASVGMTDRFGNKATKWVDGTPQAQVTVFTLFADALHRMDTRFEQSGDPADLDRRSKWKRARSQMVDQFLQVKGEGKEAHFVNAAVPKVLLTGLRLFRQQLNARCPDRETTGQCDWARKDLGRKLSDLLSRPVFAAIADLTDKINGHEEARRQLERFLTYALLSFSGQDALQGMLASLGDLMQLLRADGDFAPIFNAVANAANPIYDADGPGATDRTVQLLKAVNDERYDRYHVMDHVLPALVTPIDNGQGLTPLEIVLDGIADINRIDTSAPTPLDEQDYRFVMKAVREFFTSDTRGFPQLYYIVKNRPKN